MNPDIAAAIPRLVEAGALPPPVALPPLGKRKHPGDKGSFPWEKGSFPETREASLGKKEAPQRQGKLPLGKRKLPGDEGSFPWEKGRFPRDEGGFPWEKGGSRETREASLRKRSFRRRQEASVGLQKLHLRGGKT